MKKLLYLIRTEADFERVVCLAISGKEKFEQDFVFVGDFSPFFDDGIKNQFQKELFKQYGCKPSDICEFTFLGRLLKKLTGGISISLEQFILDKKRFLSWAMNVLLRRHIEKNKIKIIQKIFNKIKPDVLLTDQSITDKNYIPELFRQEALKKEVPVFIFTHGAAGGLHSFFSEQNFPEYQGCTVLACSVHEDKSDADNRIVVGDMASSYPYVHFLNQKEINNIRFLDERKYRVGFMVGGTGPFTSTTGWYTMEEIIISLSENPDVAMVLKLHPREAPFIDLRMINKFNNLLLVNRETDRSRVTKWSNIIVCSDHCSTIFEPMILSKRVVAIEGKHVPKYEHNHSPLKNSSVLHISSADEFDLENIPNADPEDRVANAVALGGHGKADLAHETHYVISK